MAYLLLDLYFSPPPDGSEEGGDRHDGNSGRRRSSVLRSPSSVSHENQQLASRLRDGDPQALDACMRQYGERVVRVAEVVTRSRDTAWDIAQDVFVELWNTRERIDPTKNLGGYLYRAARHRALDALRRERSRERVTLEAVEREAGRPVEARTAGNLGDVRVESEEFRARVHMVLRDLPPRCREIFLLHREAGLEYAEIEAVLGISNATIRNQMSRATKHLARALAAGVFDDWLG